jgi:hypothetical protein
MSVTLSRRNTLRTVYSTLPSGSWTGQPAVTQNPPGHDS